METRMLAYEHARTVAEMTGWVNDLIGKEVPDAPGYRLVRVVQFQFVEHREQYAALFLVEVTDTQAENGLALKEEDMVVIERLTSSIDSEGGPRVAFPEEEVS